MAVESLIRQMRRKKSEQLTEVEGSHSLLEKARVEAQTEIFKMVDRAVDQLLERYKGITDVEEVKEEVRQDILALITRRAEGNAVSLGEEYRVFLKDPESKQKILRAFNAAMDRPVAANAK